MLKTWRELSYDDKWQVIKYLATPIWAVLFILYPPAALVGLLGQLYLLAIPGLALAGVLPAAMGVLIHNHLFVELPGAAMRYGAFVAYFAIQASLALAGGDLDRLALSGLVFLLILEVTPRMVFLLRTLWHRIITPEPQAEVAK